MKSNKKAESLRAFRLAISATLMFPHAVPAGLAVWTLMSLPVLSGVVVSSHAASPQMIDFQGRLTDASNNPRTGTYSIVFRIFDAVTAGNQLWTETQGSVDVQNGFFSVQLGASAPIPLTAFTAADAYLEIVVAGETLSPRQQLLSSPFAFTLLGRTTDYFVSTGAVNQSIAGSKYFTGTVGVGTTSLNAKFHVAATNDQIVMEDTDGGTDAKKWLIKSDGGLFEVVAANDAFDGFSAAMQVNRNGTGITRVAFPNGSVGVGTFFPDARLHVSSAAGTVGPQVIVSTGSTKLFEVNGASVAVNVPLYFPDGSAQTTAFTGAGAGMDATSSTQTKTGGLNVIGSVGLGTSLPTSKFDLLDGSITVRGSNAGMQLPASGNIQFGGAYRLEENSGNLFLFGDSGFQVKNRANDGWANIKAGKFIMNTGDATNPAFTVGGDENNGISMPAADVTSIITGGVERFRVDASGYAGIGTAAPSARLHVSSAAGTIGPQMIVSTGSTKIFEVTGSSVVINASSQTVILSGKVGIGTSVPSELFHVKSDQNGSSMAVFENSDSGSGAQFLVQVRNGPNVNDALRLGVQGTGFTTAGTFVQDAASISAENNLSGGLAIITRATAPIMFATGGHANERMRIDAAGNVGIGTTNPAGKLDVIGLVQASSASFTTTGSAATNVGLLVSSSAYIATSGGMVGIGTTAPRAILHTAQSDGASDIARGSIIMSRYWASDSDTRAGAIFNYYNTATSNDQLVFGVTGGGGATTNPTIYSNAKMVIQGNGNVGIGTTAPSYVLEASGATAPKFALTDTGHAHGITDFAQTGTYFLAEQVTDDDGGARVWGFSDSVGQNPFRIIGAFGNTDPTDTVPAIWLVGAKRSGTSVASLGNSETVLAVSNNGANSMTVLGNGNVGIGASPSSGRLHVYSADNSVSIFSDVANGESYANSQFQLVNQRANSVNYGFIDAFSDIDGTPDREFYVRGDGAAFADGGWNGAPDFAEWTRVDGDPNSYRVGDILIVDPAHPRTVRKGTDAMNSRLAGAIAFKPGFVGVSPALFSDLTDAAAAKSDEQMQKEYNARKMTVTGYTPVRVSNEGGDFKVGDTITLSSIPGVGKKSTEPSMMLGRTLDAFPGVTPTDNKDTPIRLEGSPCPENPKYSCGVVFAYVTVGFSDPENEFGKLRSKSLELERKNRKLEEKSREFEDRLRKLESRLK